MYRYAEHKHLVFTGEGVRALLDIRDHVRRLLPQSGAVTCGAALNGAKTGDSFTMLACVDYLVEIGELVPVHMDPATLTQNRIYTGGAK